MVRGPGSAHVSTTTGVLVCVFISQRLCFGFARRSNIESLFSAWVLSGWVDPVVDVAVVAAAPVSCKTLVSMMTVDPLLCCLLSVWWGASTLVWGLIIRNQQATTTTITTKWRSGTNITFGAERLSLIWPCAASRVGWLIDGLMIARLLARCTTTECVRCPKLGALSCCRFIITSRVNGLLASHFVGQSRSVLSLGSSKTIFLIISSSQRSSEWWRFIAVMRC